MMNHFFPADKYICINADDEFEYIVDVYFRWTSDPAKAKIYDISPKSVFAYPTNRWNASIHSELMRQSKNKIRSENPYDEWITWK